MAKNAAGSGSSSTKASKGGKKAARAEKRAAGKERRSQLWQAFQTQRKQDKKLLPYMIGAVVGTTAVLTLGLMWLVPWWMVLPLGIVLGAMFAMIIFSRRVQKNVYAQADGTPGAAAWALQNNLRGGTWRVTPAIAGNTYLDAVHRVIGRPGIVLVGEGAPHRVKPLLAQEKKKISRIVGDTPIYDIIVGNDEGETSLRKLAPAVMKLPRNIPAETVGELDSRLSVLAAKTQGGLPKGPMPAGVKQRNMQRAMRRR